MEQIRPLASLSKDELIARIEQYIVVQDLRDVEIRELHETIDRLRGELGQVRQQMEAIGAGGVSAQRITGEAS